MGTLLLRLAAPLQAWGESSKFETRRTESMPTKSGVVGLLSAALGRGRDVPPDDLNALHFGVRVDQEGSILVDFHVAKSEKDSYLTYRHYLQDAIFLVGLESSREEFLQELDDALRAPAFPLFLGRRSCPPTLPITLGIRPLGLVEALRQEPLLRSASQRGRRMPEKLRLVTDALPGEQSRSVKRDQAVSFHPQRREYVWRGVIQREPVQVETRSQAIEHDAMGELI
jgi:CRISPR system Cascade subunit CasD